MIDSVLSLFAPHYCCNCGRIGDVLCNSCKYDITFKLPVGCLLCNAPVDAGVCDTHATPYNNAWYVGDRTNALQCLIDYYKFQHQRAAAHLLSELLDHVVPQLVPDTVLVPIPTATPHIRERGYDHLALLAQRFAQRRHLSIHRILDRTHNVTQHHLSRRERLNYSQTVFRLKWLPDPRLHYLILDDVFTTGSTVTAAAQLLRSHGAQTISVAVIARQGLIGLDL